MQPFLKRAWASKHFKVGVFLVVIGAGPLLIFLAADKLGFINDPHPNPVGLGFLSCLTWPGLILILVGLKKAFDHKA